MPPVSGRRLSEFPGGVGATESFSCLDDPDGQCAVNDPVLTQHLVEKANARTKMRHMQAVASRWASLPTGEWSRVRMYAMLVTKRVL